ALISMGDVALLQDEVGVWHAMSGGNTCELCEASLKKLLVSGCRIYAGDTKRLHRIALAAGIDSFAPAFDYELAGYLLNPSAANYSAVNLAAEYGVRAEYETVPADLALVRPLCEKLREQLQQTGMLSLLEDIEQPLTAVLASMEHHGFLVDTAGISAFGEELAEMAAEELAAVYEIAGHEFNLNSPKQLGTVLFEELGLPAGRKTRTGYSTDAETLDKLKDDYPIVAHVLRYRSYQKLSATYVQGLLAAADETGRIHTEFKQTETRTGRISSANPNLQNIPIRTELGSRMRKFFVADEGNVLLDADYSQIELRVLASMSGDENMTAAFVGGHDVHTETAAEIFRVPRSMVNAELRRRAKAVNFGIVYGIGAYSLSQDVGVSVKEAAEYIDSYMQSYPAISAYLDTTVENAKRYGYVATMYGRRRYIPELQNSNKQVQALGRRLAMNTPVQGSAADIIKIAMVRVFDRLRDELPQARLILQVHDELIIECPADVADRAAAILEQTMESAAALKAPLVAEVHRGKNWYDAK
ncbi:MAG: DNA polymerase I, partial [Oscillospiraceae bacterium]|nr:DNA polymerase I [Oscillospiraceae bacterium]